MNNVEHTITKGLVTYIHTLGYDLHRRELTLLCLANPPDNLLRIVVFRNIVSYNDLWDDDDSDGDSIDSIIGLDCFEDAQSGLFTYTLRTEAREIHFTSRYLPEIMEQLSS
jgi:hypothetical protein